MSQPTTFFDFADTLFKRGATGWTVVPKARDFLIGSAKEQRIGLLANIPPGQDTESVHMLLKMWGLDVWMDAELIIIASHLPTPLPQPGAFRVAAALAECSPAELTFCSSDTAALAEAKQQNWTVIETPQSVPARVAGGLEAVGGLEALTDTDKSPTYILKGRIVTMDGQSTVLNNGRVIVKNGKIAHILKEGADIPSAFANSPEIDTQGSIYPAFIDLHNHLAYDVLPLWRVPKKFTNRTKWQKVAEYRPTISAPARVIAGFEPTAKAAARFIEAKLLIGGCAASQGMIMMEKGIVKFFKGLVRNVERTGDDRLPEAKTLVPDLKANDAGAIASFRKNLENSQAFFYHLSEGTDAAARERFTDLADNALVGGSLVGIHSLGLSEDDLKVLANAGGKIVWSPYSNLLLYGQTLDLQAVKDCGLKIALGCDWSPSGSKNPLQELKVAKWHVDQTGAPITAEELVRMVTSNPAEILGWEAVLGSLRVGALADLVVIADNADGDPYEKLIAAREPDVALVTIHGTPRYGRKTSMETLLSGLELEDLALEGEEQALYLQHPESLINDVTLADAISTLQEAMADLPKFVRESGQAKEALQAAGFDPAAAFGLVLDMDGHEHGDESGLESPLMASVDPNAIAKSVDLDSLIVNDKTYWGLLSAQTNLDPDLIQTLKNAYA